MNLHERDSRPVLASLYLPITRLVLLFGLTAVALPAPAQTQAYVANRGSNTVSAIDTATNAVIATIPVGQQPYGVVITQDGARVYVTNEADASVSVIDTATNTVVATIPVYAAGDLQGIAVTPDGRHVYVVDDSSRTVFVIDTATSSVIAPPALGGLSIIFEIAITPDGTLAYVPGDPYVHVIDIASNTVVANIYWGGFQALIAISPDGTRAYVSDQSASALGVFDIATNTLFASVPVEGPHGVAITPDGSRAYVTDWDQNTVSAIDTATNAVIATIPVGVNPNRVAITADGARAYVTNQNSDPGVSVISTASNTVVATIPVGASPIGVAVTPKPIWPVATGTNVVVNTPTLSLDFTGNVTAPGAVTIAPTDPATIGSVPGGFSVSSTVAYQISTTASFSGPVNITFQIPGPISATDFSNLQILHFNSTTGQLDTLPIVSDDPNALTITVSTTSFSPFYLTRKEPHVSALYDQTKVWKLGGTIPIKVQMLDSNGANLSSLSLLLTVRNAKLLSANTDSTPAASGNSNPDSNFRFDPTIESGGGYVYNLSTKGLSIGKYSLSFFAGTDKSFFYAVQFEVR